jgi:hypothetical protein
VKVLEIRHRLYNVHTPNLIIVPWRCWGITSMGQIRSDGRAAMNTGYKVFVAMIVPSTGYRSM